MSASKRLTIPKRLRTSKATKTAHQANGGCNLTDGSDSDNERGDDGGGSDSSGGGGEN